MPLQKDYPNPYTDSTLVDCYVYCSELNLNFATKHGRIVFSVHPDQASAYAGKPPIHTVAYDVTPTGRPAVLDQDGVTVVTPAFPSFDELIAAQYQTYVDLGTAVYTLALGQPEFAGASVI